MTDPRPFRIALSASLWLASVAGSAACGGPLERASQPSAPEGSETSALLGNPAPDFDVKPIAGPSPGQSLRSLRGHVVLLDFWGTYCGPCKQSLPKLQEIQQAFASRGVIVLGVSEDEADDRNKIAPFAASHGAKFAIAWDADRAIASLYRPQGMPASYVIDPNGIVQYAHVGFQPGDERAIRREIDAILGK